MVFHTVFSKGSLFLIGAYLLPFAFLPLLSPKWAIPALLILLSGILSTDVGQHGELAQYPAVAIPFLFIAFIEVLPRIYRDSKIQSIIKNTDAPVIIQSLYPVIIISLLFISQGRIKFTSFPDAQDAAINQVIALVPDNATVTTSNAIFPHLCTRTDTYLDAWEGEQIALTGGIINHIWGFPDKDTEYIVIDAKNDPWGVTGVSLIKTKYKLIKIIDGIELYRLNS